MQILPPPRDLTERFDLLIRRLCDAVAIQSARHPFLTPLLVLVWTRLRRMARRFASLAARMEAGRLKPPRPTIQNADPDRTRPPRPPPQPPFPSSPGWLLHYVRLEAAGTASLLRHMLEHDKELRDLLEAAPQLGRVLRPLWRLVSAGPLPATLMPPPRSTPNPPAVATATPERPGLAAAPGPSAGPDPSAGPHMSPKPA